MKKLVLLFIATLFVVNFANAATISGNIFNWDLQLVVDVKITIDTTPQQVYISKDGTYSFEVPPGAYTLKAEYIVNGILEASAEEQITITDDGNYTIDLILFPNFDIPEDDFEPFEEEGPNNLIYILMGLALIIIIIIIFFYKKRMSKKQLKTLDENTGELEKVLEFIKKQDGRTTQKDIRKALGLSEAKASLIVTELEHKKIVKRIKKGRGNIIILNK